MSGTSARGSREADLDELRRLLASLARDETPLAEVPRVPRVSARSLHWVEPRLVVEVEFAEWTTDGRLRAPVYLGLRDDRDPESVVREAPAAAGVAGGSPPRTADLEALEPRQAVLARRGDHQGRPARVLPRGRAERGPSSPRAAVHDEALPRRLAGEELLPEEHAEARAGLAPHGAVSRDVTRGRHANDRLRRRRRRPGAALGRVDGVHRPAYVDLPGRQAGAAGLGHLRPGSLGGLRVPRGRRESLFCCGSCSS